MTTRKNRSRVPVPAALLDRVSEVADRRGLVVTDLAHSIVITASKAALRGERHLLPRRARRTAGRAAEQGQPIQRWTASREELAACAAALEAQDSSVRAVLIAGFEAFLEADGWWLAMVGPGEPGWKPAAKVDAAA